jgi:hypothetical protein
MRPEGPGRLGLPGRAGGDRLASERESRPEQGHLPQGSERQRHTLTHCASSGGNGWLAEAVSRAVRLSREAQRIPAGPGPQVKPQYGSTEVGQDGAPGMPYPIDAHPTPPPVYFLLPTFYCLLIAVTT